MFEKKENLNITGERMKRVREVEKRLRVDLKGLFSNNIMVINMEEGNKRPDRLLDGRADIVICVKPQYDNIGDVRTILNTEKDFTIIEEGPDQIMNPKDHAFYLRLNE